MADKIFPIPQPSSHVPHRVHRLFLGEESPQLHSIAQGFKRNFSVHPRTTHLRISTSPSKLGVLQNFAAFGASAGAKPDTDICL